ncbi:MAG: hypothetical protein JSU68_13525 [Phycisphaerales bacterium]|nr:MAG: hypothetical protein JSU68_13525 [Phycisphaerales bacterium]
MDPELELRQAIERLYELFSRCGKPSYMQEACGGDVSETDPVGILSKPLRELTPVDLRTYVLSAISTFGTVSDYKYFLPRVYDIATSGPKHWADTPIILSKLAYGKWLSWPSAEQEAIRNFLRAWWRDTLSRYHPPVQVDDLLDGLAQCEEVDGYLCIMQEMCANELSARRHLAVLTYSFSFSPLRQDIWDCFPWWSEHPRQLRSLLSWLFDEATARFLDKQYIDPDLERELGGASWPSAEMLLVAVDRYRRRRRACRDRVSQLPLPDV